MRGDALTGSVLDRRARAKRGYSNEDLAKIYGGNKMRVYAQVWEGKPPEKFLSEYPERLRMRQELKDFFYSR